jgi:NitT/TauT family transport system substrate-binding protein
MKALSHQRHALGRAIGAGLLVCALASPAAAADLRLGLIFNTRIEGPSAPFLLPFDKGYYKAEGLNVGIETAAGSLEAIERVAAGSADMGVADVNALIKYRDGHPNAPIKAVFILYSRPPFAVIGRKSRGVRTPKDLEGKRLGAAVSGESYAYWPILVKETGIDADKISIENIGIPVREPMLAAGQVDAVTGLSLQIFIGLKERGVPVDDIVVMLMANYGLDLYGDVVIVNPKFAADQPDAVKGFLRALLKGLKDSVKSPAAAIVAVLRRNDSVSKDTETERLTLAIRDNILTPEVKANGYGTIDRQRFAHAIDQLGLAYSFKAAKPKPDDIFDATFLPPAADRRVN